MRSLPRSIHTHDVRAMALTTNGKLYSGGKLHLSGLKNIVSGILLVFILLKVQSAKELNTIPANPICSYPFSFIIEIILIYMIV